MYKRENEHYMQAQEYTLHWKTETKMNMIPHQLSLEVNL